MIDCPFDGNARHEFLGNSDFAALYNLSPIFPGHSLVVPRRHVERLAALTDAEVAGLFVFARRVARRLGRHFGGDGEDWAIQDGASAGQTVPHVHLHLIPRRTGDLAEPGDWSQRLREQRRPLPPAELDRIVAELREP